MKHSLQRTLNLWTLSAVLGFSLLAGLISGWTAFGEAHELQDTQLQQVAVLSATHTGIISHKGKDIDPDELLVVQRLEERSAYTLPLPPELADGFHTLMLGEQKWRVYVHTVPQGLYKRRAGGRFAVSQRTEVRNEAAWGSTLRTLVPMLLLIPLLMAMISLAIHRGLKPISSLSDSLDRRNENNLQALPDDDVPQELLSFTYAINRLLARLQQVINQQQRFIADAAHELRTPVTAISLHAENLANADTLETARQRLQPVEQGLAQLRLLISQLLDLARLQGTPMTAAKPARPQPTDLQQTLQSIIAELYPLAEAKSIDLGVLRSESLLVADTVDTRLSILVRNAIENALRYTPTGGQVDISLLAENGRAVLRVADTGCGIPVDELSQVFEPFYRVGISTEPGNGLGLAISQEIARQLGGSISLHNRSAGGLEYIYSQQLLSLK